MNNLFVSVFDVVVICDLALVEVEDVLGEWVLRNAVNRFYCL